MVEPAVARLVSGKEKGGKRPEPSKTATLPRPAAREHLDRPRQTGGPAGPGCWGLRCRRQVEGQRLQTRVADTRLDIAAQQTDRCLRAQSWNSGTESATSPSAPRKSRSRRASRHRATCLSAEVICLAAGTLLRLLRRLGLKNDLAVTSETTRLKNLCKASH